MRSALKRQPSVRMVRFMRLIPLTDPDSHDPDFFIDILKKEGQKMAILRRFLGSMGRFVGVLGLPPQKEMPIIPHQQEDLSMPITANPAAVDFWSPTDKGKTSITCVPAKIFRFVGANETQFDATQSAVVTATKQDATLAGTHLPLR